MKNTQTEFNQVELELIESCKRSVAYHKEEAVKRIAHMRKELADAGCPDYILDALDWTI